MTTSERIYRLLAITIVAAIGLATAALLAGIALITRAPSDPTARATRPAAASTSDDADETRVR